MINSKCGSATAITIVGVALLLLSLSACGSEDKEAPARTTFSTPSVEVTPVTPSPPQRSSTATPRRPIPPAAAGTSLPPVPRGAPAPGPDGLPPLPPAGAPAPGPNGEPPASSSPRSP